MEDQYVLSLYSITQNSAHVPGFKQRKAQINSPCVKPSIADLVIYLTLTLCLANNAQPTVISYPRTPSAVCALDASALYSALDYGEMKHVASLLLTGHASALIGHTRLRHHACCIKCVYSTQQKQGIFS
jgi:hypothetical protein